MKRSVISAVVAFGLLTLVAGAAAGQINPTPFFTNFHDTLFSSTFNGELMPPGTIIEAYDPDGVLCGMDTVTMTGAYGFMPVYGDDLANTPALDEGAEPGDSISFKVNGRDATIVSGNPLWADQSQRNVVLDVPEVETIIAVTAVSKPGVTLVAPGDTVTLTLRVRNDGNGLDFYGIAVGMSQPEGSDQLTEWETIIPDTLVYADAGETIDFDFLIRAPIWPGDTLNMVSYRLFSYLDTTVTIEDSVVVYATVTDVDDDGGVALPGSFALHQNYPNPFNPTTTISFELTARSTVILNVYDILGRQVDEQWLGDMSAGEHRVEFDGSSLASGVYFYRLSTESGSQTRKMMLLK